MEERRALGKINSLQTPLPIGAYLGLCIDTMPRVPLTPLLLRAKEKAFKVYTGLQPEASREGGSFPSLMDVLLLGCPLQRTTVFSAETPSGEIWLRQRALPRPLPHHGSGAPATENGHNRPLSAWLIIKRLHQRISLECRSPGPTLERSAHENGFRLPNARAPLSSPSVHSRAAQERAPARFRGFLLVPRTPRSNMRVRTSGSMTGAVSVRSISSARNSNRMRPCSV